MSQASQSSGSTPQELMSYIEKQPPPAPDPHSFVPDAHGVRHGQSQTPRQHGIEHSRQQVRPFFAGESQGLEFLFDVIAPDRCTRGLHYATPASKYRSKRTCRTASYHQPELPPATIQQELVRCFFHYVWPAMPVIDAADFLTAWWREQSQVSPLLLWSVFFAAASFIDSEVLKAQHMPPKMALKEQYYQNAKDLHDSRAEPDKTVLMQSALLLSTWYIDLEDRDGLTHWIGIALSLAHTIGLHRKDNYGAIHPPPFPERLRRIWRNIWWSTYYRDTWASFGLGRPMRISSEDCDAPLPSTVEVFGEDIEHLPPELRLFLPSHLQDLANLWLNFIELTTHLENITKTYYRPRSRTPTKEQVEQAEQVIMASRDQLYMPRFHDAPVLAVHALHVRAYYSTVLLAIYRPYLAAAEGKSLSPDTQSIASQAEKAAAEMTTVLNEFISMNLTEMCTSQLITSTQAACQIYFWKIRHSSGLARQYAHNQLDLYMLALSDFRKTYCTADLQHKLFQEGLKALDGKPSTLRPPATEPNERQSEERRTSLQMDALTAPSQFGDGHMGATLEDFLVTFNPFMGMPMHEDLSTSVDWSLSPAR